MKKIIIFITDTISEIGWAILLFGIPALIGLYMSVQVVKECPDVFITELIISLGLGCLVGILSAIFGNSESPMYEIYGSIGVIMIVILTIVNYNILFNEERVIYKILAFISMIFPPIIPALAFFVTSVVSFFVTTKIKSV